MHTLTAYKDNSIFIREQGYFYDNHILYQRALSMAHEAELVIVQDEFDNTLLTVTKGEYNHAPKRIKELAYSLTQCAGKDRLFHPAF